MTPPQVPAPHYHIVHPLDDAPEQILDPVAMNLGTMHMSGSRWWALVTLRAYLVIMLLLVFYRGLDLAGTFDRWKAPPTTAVSP